MDTTPATGLVVQQWEDDFFTTYIQTSPFKPLMGTDENAVIQMKEDLTKKKGDSITIDATTGTNMLEGNEEDLASRSMRIYVDKRRNAVRVAEMSEQKSAIDLRVAARSTLQDWAQEDTRDLIITALGSLNGTAFLSRTAAIGDAWLVDNADRVFFGLSVGSFTDLSKLFEGGDLLWNGCIVKEVDNIPIYPNIGASATAEVTPVYLCGAQAISYALAKRWKSATQEFDYGDKVGVAIESIYGIRKNIFGTGTGDTDDLKDHGVVTGYFATTGAGTVASAGEIA